MKLRVTYRRSAIATSSPYRLVREPDREVDWANKFLDAQRVRGLSLCSLRAYAYDLLNVAHWLSARSIELATLNESALLDYLTFQMAGKRNPAPRTINHRLSVLHCVYRFHYACELPPRDASRSRDRTNAAPFGYRRTRRGLRRLRVRLPRRVVVPLTSDEVAQFWSSFRTFRDLSIVALMLFNGLRSREVLDLCLDDVRFGEGEIYIHGKGNRERLLPLAEETIHVLSKYLHIERLPTDSARLFISLKGRRRGNPLTIAGLRSLFRHHRRYTNVPKANPHRFRHTFGADMVRSGISLPALMRLMGHTYIQTTMLYVQLARADVWQEFHRAVQRRGQVGLPREL
jgi:site-specific recombinase XerD